MPLKQEANALRNNRFWQMLRQELEQEQFDEWKAAPSVAAREDVHLKTTALRELCDRIDNEAEQYEPPIVSAKVA